MTRIPLKQVVGAQPLSDALTSIANINTTGLIDRTGTNTLITRSVGAVGLQSIAANTQIEARTALGIPAISQVAQSVRIRGGTSDYATNYTLSLQSDQASTWLEILNNEGTNKGAFFGVLGNKFQQYNWAGGDINWFVSEIPSSIQKSMTLNNKGHLILTGSMAPQWYTAATKPNPSSVPYGAIAILYGGPTPSTHLMVCDQSNWYLVSSGAIVV